MLENIKTYAVTAKCGHVGKGKYIPITFPVKAVSRKEAAASVRQYPRVKHDHKDAILSVEEISLEEYYEIKIKNNQNPYLSAKNIQEQRMYCIDLENEILEEETKEKRNKKELNQYKNKKQKEIFKSIVNLKFYEMEYIYQ